MRKNPIVKSIYFSWWSPKKSPVHIPLEADLHSLARGRRCTETMAVTVVGSFESCFWKNILSIHIARWNCVWKNMDQTSKNANCFLLFIVKRMNSSDESVGLSMGHGSCRPQAALWNQPAWGGELVADGDPFSLSGWVDGSRPRIHIDTPGNTPGNTPRYTRKVVAKARHGRIGSQCQDCLQVAAIRLFHETAHINSIPQIMYIIWLKRIINHPQIYHQLF